MIPSAPDNTDVWIGFGLFVASELIGLSKARGNSVLQLVLHMAQELFPYEVKRRDRATHANRPRVRRASNGQFTSRNDENRD
jgi:hypothetical protein